MGNIEAKIKNINDLHYDSMCIPDFQRPYVWSVKNIAQLWNDIIISYEQEKKEYLDGWQRLKADTLNNRKQQTDTIKVAQTRAVNEFLQNLLPALDSFDIALHSPTWESVDQVWRTGIEYVHTQLLTSLEGAGITVYGEEGELFDPNLHEAIGHEDGGQSGTLARIERRGYKTGTMVIRAAQVVVYN